jgi:hypothetical protein
LVQICRKVLALLPADTGHADGLQFTTPLRMTEAEYPWAAKGGGEALHMQAAPTPRARRRRSRFVGAAEPLGEAEPTRIEQVEAGTVTGRLDGVPPLPPGYLAREELAGLVAALSEAGSGAVGLTGDTQELGLHGQGGIGKTVLACALARDDQVRARFPDGVWWVTVGEQADIVAAQLDLLSRLGAPATTARSAAEGTRLLRVALGKQRALLVVDDVWSAAAAAAFRVAGPAGGSSTPAETRLCWSRWERGWSGWGCSPRLRPGSCPPGWPGFRQPRCLRKPTG